MEQRQKIKLKNRAIISAVLLTVLIVLLCLKNSVAVSEFFATTISRGWIWLFGNLFSFLPISLLELLIIFAIIMSIYSLVRIIILLYKKRFLESVCFALVLVIAGLSIGVAYTATASMSYNREVLDIPYYEHSAVDENEQVTANDILALCNTVTQRLNEITEEIDKNADGTVKYPYSFAEMSELLQKEYERLDSDYFSSYTPSAKKILFKNVMSQFHITGVFFSVTGEACLNGYAEQLFDYPFTMAHEMAHSKGVMREYDANSVAFYLLASSDNIYLQYSCLARYYSTLRTMVSYYSEIPAESVLALSATARAQLTKDFAAYSALWDEYTLLKDVGTFFNNVYLKLSGQSDGVESYTKSEEVEINTEIIDNQEVQTITVVSFSNIQSIAIQLFLDGKLFG